MDMRPLKHVALGLFVMAIGLTPYTSVRAALESWQQRTPPADERAQDQPFPPGSPFALLPGFKIERVTPADKTESLIVITFDSQGRPVVSQSASGNGSSPRILLDNDKDGIFEAEKIVSDRLNTCHGLFFDGRTLYANCRGVVDGDPEPAPAPAGPQPAAGAGRGDQLPAGRGGGGNQQQAVGIPGLYKLEDTNADDVMDTIERIGRYTSPGMGDHGPHAIRRAPDGSIMFLIGNNTYVGAPPVNDDLVDKEHSPNWNNLRERQFLPQFNDPRFGNSTRTGVHATVWRLQPDKKYALFYSGMRNPYDFAFNLAGEAFTFDSDMEWDVNAPWYREVRTVHMIPGGDSGYRNGTGKFQDEYFDTLPALRHLRRGSPVGVEFYQSYAFPTRFFDALFEADWSRGRLLYSELMQAGGTYRGREDLAEFVHGEPMPITDLEVGPDGNLYLTTGGGGIGQGGVYKVSWTGTKPPQPYMTGILAVVRQPQPLSSWGWSAIERVRMTLGPAFATELEKLARSATATAGDRARAILELHRHAGSPSGALLNALLKDRAAEVRAAAVYVAGQQDTDGAKAAASAALKDTSAFVRRRAAEALVRQGLTSSKASFAPVADIYALLRDPDRFVRYSGRLALEHSPRSGWSSLVLNESNVVALTEGLLALTNTAGVKPGSDPGLTPAAGVELRPIFAKLIDLMKRRTLTSDEKIRVLRVYEAAATEAPNGVDPEIKKQVHDILLAQLPATPPAGNWVSCTNRTQTTGCSDFLLTHHLAKVLASTGEPDVIGRILALMPKGDNDQPGQIDYVYSLRVVDTGWTKDQKQQITSWFATASKWRGGSTFAGHVNNIFDATLDAFDAEEKQLVYKSVPLFAPLEETEIAAAAAGRGGRGGGGRGGPPVPATTRNIVPLDRQERYDNLVFPRGGPAGSLTGRGGAPDAAAGEKVFRETCAECHRFGTIGKDYAPDLTKVADRLARRDILRSIFFPSERIDAKYETTVLVTRDGETIRGLVISEDGQRVVLKTANSTEPATVQKAQIKSRTRERASIMPDDIADRVTDNGVRDVTAYVMRTIK
ncbi:MAG: HEAT repeat domain-containing protein [Vicinamibacterales bacterium]